MFLSKLRDPVSALTSAVQERDCRAEAAPQQSITYELAASVPSCTLGQGRPTQFYEDCNPEGVSCLGQETSAVDQLSLILGTDVTVSTPTDVLGN